MQTINLHGEDLPRLTNPRGEDDTDKIIAMCEKSYPFREEVSHGTTMAYRIKLYRSIHWLRTQSATPWRLDQQARLKPQKLN